MILNYPSKWENSENILKGKGMIHICIVPTLQGIFILISVREDHAHFKKLPFLQLLAFCLRTCFMLIPFGQVTPLHTLLDHI